MLDKVYRPNEIERKWSAFWEERRCFTAHSDSPAPRFCIIQPPPNITGMLTVGHALGTTVQDLLVRWKRMRGYNTLWLPGVDHAGIATQKVVEQSLLERGVDRRTLGRERFLEECWAWKERYHDRIVEQENALGASLDWSRETFTLDPGVSRAVREVFVRLYEEGLIYRGRYMTNWCPACGTAISDEEVEYEDRRDKLYYIAYPLSGGDGEIVVGTTRPETMLGDVAVAVSPGHERAGELAGRMVDLPLTGRIIPIVLDEAVDPEFGTGFLKVTPAHDPTDFEIGRRHGLDPLVVMDAQGRMNEAAGRFAGLDRFEAREMVLGALEEQRLLRKVEDYDHAVSLHDRCGTVIEPAISLQWFLAMSELARPAIDVVERGEVTFFPDRWRGIYLSWMAGIRDWCISRQLWWGHRIPVWYCGDCGEIIASVDEPSSCGKCGSKSLVQDEDVLDTWFSSWLWTFSPMGWPERTQDLATYHPTDVLVTGGDIIFFWVARMIMASLKFMGEQPFSHVYITGIVRDVEGRKMSKSLGNSPDFIDIIAAHGADAFRFSLMMLSPPGQDLMFDEKRVEVGKHFANKIWNASRFVLGGEPSAEGVATERSGAGGDGRDPIVAAYRDLLGRPPGAALSFGWEDRWIASALSRTAAECENRIAEYRFDETARILYEFFWHEYCDWYLELIKPALRGEGPRAAGALATARMVLGYASALLHPFMPFITEEIWSMLRVDGVLLAGFTLPGPPAALRDHGLESDAGLFREIVTSIRNLRQSFNVPHRREVGVSISCKAGMSLPQRLGRFEDHIRLLAGVGELTIGEELPKPEGSAAAGHTGIEIYIPLGGLVDLAAERARLQREVDKLAVDCGKIEARLGDPRFRDRAPAEVVGRERERFDEMSDRRDRIERILEDLG